MDSQQIQLFRQQTLSLQSFVAMFAFIFTNWKEKSNSTLEVLQQKSYPSMFSLGPNNVIDSFEISNHDVYDSTKGEG